MSADLQATETKESERRNEQQQQQPTQSTDNHATDDEDDDEQNEEEEEGEEDEEPKLKYAKLTGNLATIYRGRDSTSAFSVVGDKMVIGSHNGSIHVLAVPSLESLRTYRAHSASVTSVSISPTPPPPVLAKNEFGNASLVSPPASAKNAPAPSRTSSGLKPQQRSKQQPIPNTPNNHIYIATSSLDGHVCISSLINPEDVQLRNFARPVNAVALSPEYKSDRTYLSGGLAGSLILTVGGKAGVSSDANTNSAAAAASGWLGAIGLGGNAGRDTSLHSGEGSISSIKWSLSGKWVVWVNEEGIKIMRSHLKLGSEDQEDAWRRIAHAARPNRIGWEEMASVWKGRCEWVNEKNLESDELTTGSGETNGTSTTTPKRGSKKIEKLIIGWGDTAFIMHVQSGSSTTQSANAKKTIGSADIIHKLQFRDCIISGITFYTPSLLAILAYRTRDDNDEPIVPTLRGDKDPSSQKGRQHRHTSLAPQLRLVNVMDGEEVELDELSRISRYETLSAQDYHLGALYMPPPLPEQSAQMRGKMGGLWDASVAATLSGGGYATRIFSSSASILSASSGEKRTNGGTQSLQSQNDGSGNDVTPTPDVNKKAVAAHPFALEPGLKLYIVSPYDCVLAVKRELSDHLEWLLEHQQYGDAWQVIDEHPEAVDTSSADMQSYSSEVSSPTKGGAGNSGTLADFFADENSSQATGTDALKKYNLAAQQEKRRIGELWLQQLISANQWDEAGRVAGKVLGNSVRWEHWIWTFAQADRFDEVTPFIPPTSMKPLLPSLVYSVVLGHYVVRDRLRLSALLDLWDPDFFDVKSVVSAIEEPLDSGEVSEYTSEDGVKGRDWRILMGALAKLYIADARPREALRCYISLQDAESAFDLIRNEKLLDAVVEDVPGLLTLRVSREQLHSAPLPELEDATSEAIQLLVEEAHRGTVPTSSVVEQLRDKGDDYRVLLFFYFRALWKGVKSNIITRKGMFRRPVEEGHALVEDHKDLAVELFAEYDRDMLLTFLQESDVYDPGKAAIICEQRHFVPELVHILHKTGQKNEALMLIVDKLGDVSKAIAFAKDEPELWNDLLSYSMDKPTFIRGLLEEVGAATAFDPIEIVRRIPKGKEIEGLKQSIQRFIREYEIQMSISEGVAKVLRSEVGTGMDTLRTGRKKAVRFEVSHENVQDVDLAIHDVSIKTSGESLSILPKRTAENRETKHVRPGHCVGCDEVFHELETSPLIGFACGHVYHLSCLLAANPHTRDSAEAKNVLAQLQSASAAATDDQDSVGWGTRSVGAKVTHAHLVRNLLEGGCWTCGGGER